MSFIHRIFLKKRITKRIILLQGKLGYYAGRGIMNTGIRSSNTEEYDLKARTCREKIDSLQELIN